MIHNEAEIAEFRARGIHVIRRGDREYPRRLENLQSPPEVLYCRGNLELLTRHAVSIVGTRNCTRYGIDVAKRFAKVFAENNVVVVSGLADGIDTAAHMGAGEENTIAVLGNGFNIYYPYSNRKLQDAIAEKGLLISEYPPETQSQRFFFPQRNRIVAALGGAVLIVEADLKSGTMITKDFALDLGIDVFAVPGEVTSLQSRGTNDLIKTAACAIATEPADVLAVFGVTAKSRKEKNVVVQISFDEKHILDAMGRGKIHIDELVEKIDMPIRKLATILTEMEMHGLIEKLPGNMFEALI